MTIRLLHPSESAGWPVHFSLVWLVWSDLLFQNLVDKEQVREERAVGASRKLK